MSIRLILALLFLGTVLGCHKKSEANSPDTAGTPPPPKTVGTPSVFTVPPVRAPNPNDVVAEANGKKLLRKEADAQVDAQISPVRSQIPPDKLDGVVNQVRRQVLQQFVMKSLLVAEADRRGITVTPTDTQKAFKQITEKLPKGMTPQEAMKKSPLGEDYMRGEILTGIKIEKLLDQSLTNDLAVSDQSIKSFYEENKDRLATPESVHVRHILIGVDEKDDAATRAQKRKKADDVRAQLLKGADFAKLAEEYSSCPSRSHGGDLGTFKRLQMVEPFDKASFEQQVNEIGPIVETKFGYHIIQVLEHNMPAKLTPEKAGDVLRQQNKRQAIERLVNQLKATAQIKPATILDSEPRVPPPPPSRSPQSQPKKAP